MIRLNVEYYDNNIHDMPQMGNFIEGNDDLINNFKQTIDNDRITISSVHMTKKYDINELDIICDIRDDDVSYQFEDQLRIIENIYHYLKPGGRLIIEDIDNSYENNYSVLLDKFKHCYFIKLDDNTKLVILIKNEYSLFY